ncbi:ISChy9, transposase orfB [Neobacillus bataviensis LMG 21833]|uniref:ISChy9, transposase orfB n=1 Tax=Neobacillus bataviensis LMG 21833 TaxID=1117379 RepID=K6DP42_9BACI|nr:RNA-guided endonuclease TnpB family protein [Neobacillus bataviensis]EKN62541.1 ISChy9, transposase orfB [Neobacillus bataviensis LMG 21833]
MATSKDRTPSFVATIRLKTNLKEEKQLLVLSDCARQLYNACLGESLKRLKKVQGTDLYKETIQLSKVTEADVEKRRANFKYLNDLFGFTDASIQSFGIKTKNDSQFIAEHLGTHVCQKISTRAFKATQKYAFKCAKKVRFKRKGEFVSIEGKNNKTFLMYSNGYVFVGKNLTLKCLIDPKDQWMQYALKQKIKYCRMIKKEVKGKKRFYVQLILEGNPYQKYELGKENIGLDIGPSTIAIVGESQSKLKEFCEEVVLIDKEKRRINRKMDRQRRVNNPGNYYANGTVKKGSKKWVHSNRYLHTRSKHRELERKIKEVRKQLHGRDTNQILQLASSIKTEKLSYKAFQKMFGKSVGRKAPSMFLNMLKRKVKARGGSFREFPTSSTKLSQTCHCGMIKKKQLKERWHKCECGLVAQRDLYSAYLARYVTNSNHVDIKKAKMDWIQFSNVLDECVSKLESMKAERKFISTFGI